MNMLKKQSWTADKRWSSSFEVGRGTHLKKPACYQTLQSSEWKRPFVRARRRWEDNTKTDIIDRNRVLGCGLDLSDSR
jgi:hypothetical protein